MRASTWIWVAVVAASLTVLVAGAVGAQTLVIRTGPGTAGYTHYQYRFGDWSISYSSGYPYTYRYLGRYSYCGYWPGYYRPYWGSVYRPTYYHGHHDGHHCPECGRSRAGRTVYYDRGLYNGLPVPATVFFSRRARVIDW